MRDDDRLSAAERRQFDEIVTAFTEVEPFRRGPEAEARIAAARIAPTRDRGRRWPRRRRDETA